MSEVYILAPMCQDDVQYNNITGVYSSKEKLIELNADLDIEWYTTAQEQQVIAYFALAVQLGHYPKEPDLTIERYTSS